MFVKLFRFTDVNGERFHIAAPGFSEAVAAIRAWEGMLSYDPDNDAVRSLEIVEDLVVNGRRDTDIGSDAVSLMDALLPPVAPPPGSQTSSPSTADENIPW